MGIAVKILAGLLVLGVATSVHAQSPPIAIDVTGEHRMTSTDTADSARQLARVDARRRAWSVASAHLQSRDDVKALQLTPLEIDAFTFVLLELQEQPTKTATTSARGPMQVRLRGRIDGDAAVKRIALVRKDQDATFDVIEAWSETQRLHEQLAKETQPQNQIKTVVALNAKHLAARASAALARTEPSAVGGRSSSDAGRLQAEQLADAAIAMDPDSADAHDVMGDLFLDVLEPDAAEEHFRKARSVDAESTTGRTKLAEALRLQGRFDEAVDELLEALRIDPKSARAHSGLGLAYRGQRKNTEAIAEYREAIRLDPDLIDAHNGLAVMLAGQGDLEEAVSEFRQIVRIDPDSAIGYYNLAYALADLDRDVESAAALREVIRINPNHYNARYNLGELFRLEAKYDESAKQFREYLRLAPDTPQNQRNIERAKGFVEKFSDQ
jgi:tetratricopeptide (TPR) repeat protein